MVHLIRQTHIVAILDQGAVPNGHFRYEFIEVAYVGFQFC